MRRAEHPIWEKAEENRGLDVKELCSRPPESQAHPQGTGPLQRAEEELDNTAVVPALLRDLHPCLRSGLCRSTYLSRTLWTFSNLLVFVLHKPVPYHALEV